MQPEPFHPTHLAGAPWRPWQRNLLIGVLLGLAAQAILSPVVFLSTWNLATLGLFGVVIGFKVLAVFLGQFRRFVVSPSREELDALVEADLPDYTVLVPLFRETEVLWDLVEALRRLDYPKEKLDIVLLLEECDTNTRDAAAALRLEPPFRTVVVPEGQPRTKPRACNYGLALARGEFLVIYDAEDRPEPDQLRKAVAAFRRLPDSVMCLQAKLNLYNSRQNLLSRWFTLEYSAWFDLYLPGLHALHSPIPLGGTSNHIRTAALCAAGGWDPYNVTEDCDLGVRLSRRGRDIRILDSTTWEEAPTRLLPWLRQRSRWIKGYWQTLLVHTRSPLAALREMGPWRFFQLLVTVGGQVATLLLMPICWAILGAWLVLRWQLFDPSHPWTAVFLGATALLLLFNGYFVLVHLVAAVRRRNYGLLPAGLLLPVYWFLMGFGAWFGFLQFFWSPFSWLKTPHGLAIAESAAGNTAAADAAMARPAARRIATLWTTAVFAAGLLAVTAAVLSLPRALRLSEQVHRAAIRLDGPFRADEIAVDKSWFGRTQCRVTLQVDPAKVGATVGAHAVAALQPGDARILVYAKVIDGEWFQIEAETYEVVGGEIRLTVPLDTTARAQTTARGTWQPAPSNGSAVWGPWSLRRVRAVGVRVFGQEPTLASLKVTSAVAEGEAPRDPLVLEDLTAPDQARQRDLFEARFHLEREYDNPFDPRQIDIEAEFVAPSGKKWRVPAFYGQDYERRLTDITERLVPTGEPYWAVRFMPHEEGDYTWRLVASDSTSATLATAPRALAVTPSDNRGYLGVSRDPRYFGFENDDFFYPVIFNVCWPRDTRTEWIGGGYKNADRSPDTLLYAKYFDKMAAAGVTVARVWMTPWWCGLEWNRSWPGYHGLGRYSLEQAWRLDYLLQQARRRDLMVEVVLNSHGAFTETYDSQWNVNPYNAANGGMLRSPGEILTNREGIDAMKRRVRYTVARYGAYPNLFAYLLWIEINVVNPNAAARVAWHQEMSRYIHEVDESRHMVTAEYADNGDRPVWDIPTVDYTQAPGYDHYGFIASLQGPAQAFAGIPKPFLIEEYGGSWRGSTPNHLALQLHNGPWAGWNLPLSATPMPWWWNFIFDWDLQRYWAIFAEYIHGEDLRDVKWRFAAQAVEGSGDLKAMTRLGADRGYGWVYSEKSALTYNEPKQMFVKSPPAAPGAAPAPAADLFPPVEKAAVVLTGLQDGRYAVEYWDTWVAGQVTKAEAVAQGGRLRLELPRLTRDVAFKVRRVADQ